MKMVAFIVKQISLILKSNKPVKVNHLCWKILLQVSIAALNLTPRDKSQPKLVTLRRPPNRVEAVPSGSCIGI